MLKPRKLVIYLAAFLIAFTALAAVFREALVQIAIATFLLCVLIDALIEGEIGFGQYTAKRKYRRSEAPIAYWSVVAVYCLVLGSVVILAVEDVRRSKEPNQPPQRNAGSRPFSGDSPASETPSSLGPRG